MASGHEVCVDEETLGMPRKEFMTQIEAFKDFAKSEAEAQKDESLHIVHRKAIPPINIYARKPHWVETVFLSGLCAVGAAACFVIYGKGSNETPLIVVDQDKISIAGQGEANWKDLEAISTFEEQTKNEYGHHLYTHTYKAFKFKDRSVKPSKLPESFMSSPHSRKLGSPSPDTLYLRPDKLADNLVDLAKEFLRKRYKPQGLSDFFNKYWPVQEKKIQAKKDILDKLTRILSLPLKDQKSELDRFQIRLENDGAASMIDTIVQECFVPTYRGFIEGILPETQIPSILCAQFIKSELEKMKD